LPVDGVIWPSDRHAGLCCPGLGAKEFREVADIIAGAPTPSFDGGVAVNLRDRVSALADKFPLYRGLLS
jgi:glycine hydroxymethyltransferase